MSFFVRFSNFKEQVKESPGLLESSTNHHGRALLEYTEKYNIDVKKFSQVNQNNSPSGLHNTIKRRENKKNLMKKGLEIERDSGKTVSSSRRTRVLREETDRRTAGSAARNVTQQTPIICKPPPTNETENNR